MDKLHNDAASLNRVSLRSPKGDSPLDQVVKELLETAEVQRIKTYARFLDAFHLKNTVTTEIDQRWVSVNGKRVVNFSSANYLGFDQHPELIRRGQAALAEWGTHTGSSRIFTNHENMLRLEYELADLVGAEKTLVGVNVSMTHQMVIPTLFGRSNVRLLVDRHAHTSIYQACLTAKARGAEVVSVDVSDLDKVAKELSKTSDRQVLLVDGIYSMQGHFPDFTRLADMCAQANAIFYVDDAHGTGIYGKRGGGVVEEFALSYANLILVGSLQKGLACFGGFVAGSATLIDLIRVTSKPFIFSGPLQPAMVEQGRAAVALCQSEEGQRLRRHVRQMSLDVRSQLQGMGFAVPDGDSPIVPVPIGSEVLTLMAGRKMFDQGVYLNSVLFPAVPKDQGILRISLSAIHTPEQVEHLIKGMKNLKEYLALNSNPWKRALHMSAQLVKANWQGDEYVGL